MAQSKQGHHFPLVIDYLFYLSICLYLPILPAPSQSITRYRGLLEEAGLNNVQTALRKCKRVDCVHFTDVSVALRLVGVATVSSPLEKKTHTIGPHSTGVI